MTNFTTGMFLSNVGVKIEFGITGHIIVTNDQFYLVFSSILLEAQRTWTARTCFSGY